MNILPPHSGPKIETVCSSVLKMKAICFSETSVSTYRSTWCYYQETKIDIFTAVRTSNLDYGHLPALKTSLSGNGIPYPGGNLELWNARSRATSYSPAFPEYHLHKIT
jgi:hypothetical protein